MNTKEQELLGLLIGLSRSTTSSDVNELTHQALHVGLETLVNNDDDSISNVMELITEEKRRLVPDCFSCMNPCGRTFNYDFKDLEKLQGTKEYELKQELIQALLAHHTSQNHDVLYRALFYIGDRLKEEYLQAMIDEVNAL